jgi:hypothetical protein
VAVLFKAKAASSTCLPAKHFFVLRNFYWSKFSRPGIGHLICLLLFLFYLLIIIIKINLKDNSM